MKHRSFQRNNYTDFLKWTALNCLIQILPQALNEVEGSRGGRRSGYTGFNRALENGC